MTESDRLAALNEEITALSEEDRRLLENLRRKRLERLSPAAIHKPSPSQRLADRIAAIVGSWPFVAGQSFLLILWVALNVFAWSAHWDPYPFILLNLLLSFQAAYTAPIILMSQNRQSAIDRATQISDFEVNLKAELEIELLHHKIDLLRSREIERLIRVIEELSRDLAAARAGA